MKITRCAIAIVMALVLAIALSPPSGAPRMLCGVPFFPFPRRDRPGAIAQFCPSAID